MLELQVKVSAQLTPAECAAWDRLQAGDRAYESPYFAREFFEAVSRHSGSARVAVILDGATPVGFFAFHRGPLGLARPLGGPLSDCHGLILERGTRFTAEMLMRAAGLRVLPLSHALGSRDAFAPYLGPRYAMHVIDLSEGFAAYENGRKALAKSAFRAIRTRSEKAAKQIGAVTFQFSDRSAESLAALVRWKAEQYRATRQIDVLGVGWVSRLVEDLHAQPDNALRGQLSTLWFGSRLAAAHFGLRTPSAMHYWFPGYDAELAELSPGNILLYRMAEAAAKEGCRAIHLGPGDYRYKLEFANASLPLAEGLVRAPGLVGAAAGAGKRLIEALGRTLPARVATLPAGALRRLDRAHAFRSI